MTVADSLDPSSWRKQLDALPVGGRIPAFFFAHGSPLLIWPERLPASLPLDSIGGPRGPNAQFLKDFGKTLVEKYNPKAIVVFSAHWETHGQIEVMSYERNHLLYDYYNFPEEMYRVKFESKGSPAVASRIVELLQRNNIKTRTLRQGRGLDHGVFVPFKLMFPTPCPIPIIEVSMDATLDPERLLELGRALIPLRDEGVLILSGGLTIHTFKEWDAWNPKTAPQGFKDFEKSIVDSVNNSMTTVERNENLKEIMRHPFFRRAHPREEHFVPIYIAAGAGSSDGDGAYVLADIHSAISIAFGV